jgi:hypothetical protein
MLSQSIKIQEVPFNKKQWRAFEDIICSAKYFAFVAQDGIPHDLLALAAKARAMYHTKTIKSKVPYEQLCRDYGVVLLADRGSTFTSAEFQKQYHSGKPDSFWQGRAGTSYVRIMELSICCRDVFIFVYQRNKIE